MYLRISLAIEVDIEPEAYGVPTKEQGAAIELEVPDDTIDTEYEEQDRDESIVAEELCSALLVKLERATLMDLQREVGNERLIDVEVETS